MTVTSTTRVVRIPYAARLAVVRTVHDITSSYRRITLGGDELAGFQSLDAGDHFKLALPAPGESVPTLPIVGPDGVGFPEGTVRPILRDYTPRRFDAERNELTVDFVLHGDGPAAAWAAHAAPGQRVGVLGPRGSHIVEAAHDWYLMIGDETVLPEIARRLEEAPPGWRINAFIEVDRVTDQQSLPTEARADIRWVLRNGAEAGVATVLEDALRAFPFPGGTFFTWAGGEANLLRSIRRFLVRERGVSPAHASFSGHWKRGVADHDHHEPIED